MRAGRPPTVLVGLVEVGLVEVGLVEVGRGTEHGERHWSKKARDYVGLFESGALLQLTGYARARVLVFATGEGRGNS